MSKANKTATVFFVAQALGFGLGFLFKWVRKGQAKFEVPVLVAGLLGVVGGLLSGWETRQIQQETKAKRLEQKL